MKDEENLFNTLLGHNLLCMQQKGQFFFFIYWHKLNMFNSRRLFVVQLHFNATLDTTNFVSRDSDFFFLFFYKGAGDIYLKRWF